MDNRPIGIYDSGVGGLTSISSFFEVLPSESIIYAGDTARAPYGPKTPAQIRRFSLEIADFLAENDVKIVIAACNTSSSYAMDTIKIAHPDLLVQGIIKPCAEQIARTCGPDNSIGIIATPATVRSMAYARELHKRRGDLTVHSLACPDFVPAIESGSFTGSHMEKIVSDTLSEFVEEYRIDTLVLGCTHYPLIRGTIEELFPRMSIIDPSMALALKVKKTLEEKDMLAESGRRTMKVYASRLTPQFEETLKMLGITADSIEEHIF